MITGPTHLHMLASCKRDVAFFRGLKIGDGDVQLHRVKVLQLGRGALQRGKVSHDDHMSLT